MARSPLPAPRPAAAWVPVEDALGRLAPGRHQICLSAAEVIASGEPALFTEYGELLLFVDGQLVDVRAAKRSADGVLRAPLLPASIIKSAVGIEYGWRHKAACACRVCHAAHLAGTAAA